MATVFSYYMYPIRYKASAKHLLRLIFIDLLHRFKNMNFDI